jgi:hypothetical protein
MRHLISILALAFFVSNCSNPDEITLLGKWHDTNSYPSNQVNHSTGEIVAVSYPDIMIEFMSPDSFSIEGEVPYGIHGDGRWILTGNTLSFNDIEEMLDTIEFSYFRKHTWDILSHSEDSLVVLSHYVGEPFIDPDSLAIVTDSVRLDFIRRFVRIE